MSLFVKLNNMGMVTNENVRINTNANQQYICPNDETVLENRGHTYLDYVCPKCKLFVRGPLLVRG